MKEKVSGYISEKYQNILSDFRAHIDEALTQKELSQEELSQEEYDRIILSLENEDFKKFLFTFGSIELINIIGAKIKYSIIALLSLRDPDNTVYYFAGIWGGERVLRVMYSFSIAQSQGLQKPLSFGLLNSIPFGKVVTPALWLKSDKDLIKYFSAYQKEKIHAIASHPLLQGAIKTLV